MPKTTTQIKIDNVVIDVLHKDVKHMRMVVSAPNGAVRITAPKKMDIKTIREFAQSKIEWIKKHQARFNNRQKVSTQDFLDRESHYYNGQPYSLNIIERHVPPDVKLNQGTIDLYVRPGTTPELCQAILLTWYKIQLHESIPALIAKWQPVIGVRVDDFGVRQMKTRWGSCNIRLRRIWLNLELAKRPPECLEYVVVHEMIHLLEKSHNARFKAFMDKFIPNWRIYKEELDRFPIGY